MYLNPKPPIFLISYPLAVMNTQCSSALVHHGPSHFFSWKSDEVVAGGLGLQVPVVKSDSRQLQSRRRREDEVRPPCAKQKKIIYVSIHSHRCRNGETPRWVASSDAEAYLRSIGAPE